ncbi:unnamed protein product [Leptidea sinapis]|uniref:Uncharacterized protein n=1 Tax=Leptidea sinapis TaxID=189913 RepID=A0A5E4QF37_9NEOP|nr:unnamed protein product [Leptidea sinapis]
MLCPEVSSFPPPITYSTIKKDLSLEDVINTVELNNFYKSAIITCPDEVNVPAYIEDTFDDSDYYEISNLSLTEFIDPVFIETFVKHGRIYCLSINRKCINQNCAAITLDGVLTLHVLENIYQTLGIEGVKQPNNFYGITLDLNNLKRIKKLTEALRKLELFEFHMSWVPHEEDICPSTIAKYFSDKNCVVRLCNLKIEHVVPQVKEVPSLCDVDLDQVVEWAGMLLHGCDLYPEDNYTSTYYVPDSASPLKTSRISILIIKGFITPDILKNTCKSLSEHVSQRDVDYYWCALSLQSQEEEMLQMSLVKGLKHDHIL